MRVGRKVTLPRREELQTLRAEDLLVIDVPIVGSIDPSVLEPVLNAHCRLLLTGGFQRVIPIFGVDVVA